MRNAVTKETLTSVLFGVITGLLSRVTAKEIVGTFDSGEEYVLLIPGDHVVGPTFKDTFCLKC